ncbi:MAG TPA: BTAD domain-containing putative transcriptional regulator [Crinalium sp.]
MAATLHIQLLGEFAIRYDGASVAGFTTGRSRALLAYLLLHRHAPQLRQRLAFQLWTESTDEQGRANLRKELSYLRRSLPDSDDFLAIDVKTLQWQPNASFTLDVADFEASLKTASQTADPNVARPALEKALELYRGDLLPDCDDEWILPERERLQRSHANALVQLITLLETQQDYRVALGYTQQLMRLDPLNETTYSLLMRLHWQSGDRANALQTYHRCMTLLREELGVDPSPATRRLYEQVLNDDGERLPQPSPIRLSEPIACPPRLSSPLLSLVGRDREWVAIQQWIARKDGDREVLLLMGEPGIGKTRLLEELQNMLQGDRYYLLWGRGFEAEMMRPYGVWIDALRSLLAHSPIPIPKELGCLLPEVGWSEALADRSRLFDAVVQFLAGLCANNRSVAVILDDIQWIDEASCALLHYATRLLNRVPVLFACTSRSKELDDNASVSRVVQALRRERRLQTIELRPLTQQDTTELIHRMSQTQSLDLCWEQVADRIFLDSGGNPLFALEITRALSYGDTRHSDNLELLIRDRLQRLDDTARELIPWAAALGQSFKPTLVAHVADYPMAKLLMAIEQLEQQTIIRTSAATSDEICYDFAHDIVRQVAYRQLSEPRRRLVHLQIAHKLNQLVATDQALAVDIAHHASLGGDRALSASASLTAAERCLKLFAYAEAAELAQRGMQDCQVLDDRTRIRLHLNLLLTYILAGVTAEQTVELENDAQRLIQNAIALGLRDEETLGLEVLVTLNFKHNNYTNVHQHSLKVAEVSRAASPVRAAQMLAYSGACLAEIGREMTRAEAILLEAQSLAARVDLKTVDLYSGLGTVERHKGNYAEARSLLQQAWRMAQAEQDHWREYYLLSYLAMLELEAGHPVLALPHCRDMASVAMQMQGEGSECAFAAALEALVQYVLREPSAAVALNQAIATLKTVDAKRMLSYVLAHAAQVDLECDRFDLAVHRAEAALEAAQVVNQPSEMGLAWAVLVQAELERGDRQRATDWFEALYRDIDRHALSTSSRRAVEQVMQRMRETVSSRRS